MIANVLCIFCGQFFRAWSPSVETAGRVGICREPTCAILHWDGDAQSEKLGIVDEAMLRSAMST